jgi:hypothetical protein
MKDRHLQQRGANRKASGDFSHAVVIGMFA